MGFKTSNLLDLGNFIIIFHTNNNFFIFNVFNSKYRELLILRII